MHKYQSAEIGELSRAHTPTHAPGPIRFEFSRQQEQPEKKNFNYTTRIESENPTKTESIWNHECKYLLDEEVFRIRVR